MKKHYIILCLVMIMVALPVIQVQASADYNSKSVYYTVKPGDILWNIAQEHNTTVARLVELNDIEDAYDLYAGRQLIVDENEANNSSNYIHYNIKPGDMLWNIAQEYGTTVEKLVKLNNIRNAYSMYVGRRLIIPVNDSTKKKSYSYPLYYVHQVQEDEKITKMANKFGVRVSALLATNDISDSSEVKTGDSLVIPLTNSNKFGYLKWASTQINNNYRVGANQTLTDIAEEFNTSEEALRLINNLDEEEQVRIGQRLLMPVNPAFFKKHKIYRIKEDGEYIFDIAFEKSITIKSLLQANYWKDPNVKLKAGKVILVPLDEDSKTEWVEYENGKPKNGWLN